MKDWTPHPQCPVKIACGYTDVLDEYRHVRNLRNLIRRFVDLYPCSPDVDRKAQLLWEKVDILFVQKDSKERNRIRRILLKIEAQRERERHES